MDRHLFWAGTVFWVALWAVFIIGSPGLMLGSAWTTARGVGVTDHLRLGAGRPVRRHPSPWSTT